MTRRKSMLKTTVDFELMESQSGTRVTPPVDKSILHEIVRVIAARGKVPERVALRARNYLITYLDDHRQRLEDALRRHDLDRVNMLYGQLASKVKYQLLRGSASRERPGSKARDRVGARAKVQSGRQKQRGSAVKKLATVKKRSSAGKKTTTKRRAVSRAARS